MDSGSAALADYIFASKYANHRADDKRRETWGEAVDRVFGMHRSYFTKDDPTDPAQKVIREAIDAVEEAFRAKEILGSQRALQFGGTAMLQKHARGYNCTFSYADRTRFFAESFWLLLCGCGVGFSVQRQHVRKLPKIWAPHGKARTFVVPDTIEGWADAADELMRSYFEGGRPVVFDYSLIRAKGSPISTGAGRAPGPDPLRSALEDVRALLNRCLDGGRHRMRPIDVYDAVMFLSQAVLSGGVRRSATICLFSSDDGDMISAKTGDWWKENGQRARSNNSAVLVRGQTTREQFRRVFDAGKEWGDPGFYWVDDPEIGTNPCVEIGLYPVDLLTGETGWQFCNLSLINMTTVRDLADFTRRAALAAMLGTLQAAYTDFGYLGAVSERITRRESLLGVSMTGMRDRPDLAFDPAALTEAAKAAVEANEHLALALGIPAAARVTCVKPEGTSSCLLGTSSGIHAHHGRRYIRRVQASADEAPAMAFAAANPKAVSLSRRIGDSGRNDLILSFAIEAPEGAHVQADMRAVSFLEDVRTVKEAWVDAGRNLDRCAHPGLSNNVSNTVTVADHEWEDVADMIYDGRDVFAGVSMLGAMGDLGFTQAPFVACEGDGDRAHVVDEWETLRESTVAVDYSAMIEEENATAFGEISACAGGSCAIV